MHRELHVNVKFVAMQDDSYFDNAGLHHADDSKTCCNSAIDSGHCSHYNPGTSDRILIVNRSRGCNYYYY